MIITLQSFDGKPFTVVTAYGDGHRLEFQYSPEDKVEVDLHPDMQVNFSHTMEGVLIEIRNFNFGDADNFTLPSRFDADIQASGSQS